MRIALAHDSFTQYGGAERVIEALHELYPDASVYTTVVDPHFPSPLTGWDIHASGWLQAMYDMYSHFQHLLVLIPAAVSTLRIEPVDIVLSASSSFIKGIYKPKGSLHINYCHTPTRFLWSEPNYITEEVPPLLRPIVRPFLRWMRKWDYRAAQRVDYFIANSKEVQKRITQYYNKQSEVIYPFIDTNFWKPTRPKSDYFLIAGRLNAHKSNEIVIHACNELGLPLHVVGSGRQEKYLRSIAGPTVQFLGRVSDARLRDEYSGARGFIYPQFEDIGLMPLEAAACGTATLALARGGSLETVLPGVTGELFERPEKEILKSALAQWSDSRYAESALRAHAATFSKDIFKERMSEFISRIAGVRP